MKPIVLTLAWLVCAGALVACDSAPMPSPITDDSPRRNSAYVFSNGWHTAIVVARDKAVAIGVLPEAADFPTAAFLEFGWGDRTYYPAKDKTLGMALNAALTATPAVMHMAGRAHEPSPTYAHTDMVTIALTDAGFRNLVDAIASEFKRPVDGRAAPVANGLYADSYFYDAHGSFHLFNTCNTWTARMLRAGGVALSPSGVMTADELMARLRTATKTKERSN